MVTHRDRKVYHQVWFDNTGHWPDWEGKREVIHHKNGDPNDNRFENLELMTASEHSKLHHAENSDGYGMKGSTFSEESRVKISKKLSGIKRSEDFKRKCRAAKLGNKNASGKRSEGAKQRMREAWIKRKQKAEV